MVFIHLINQKFSLGLTDDKMMDYARKLGADCAFFIKNNTDLNVWHAGNQLQIQVHFEDNAGQAGARAAELKLATIAVTRF